jgi:hypothetical protein
MQSDGAILTTLEGEVTGTKIFLTISEVIGEMPAVRLALVAAASLTASDLKTSCAAAHATASCRLLDLGEAFTMEEPSLGLSFLSCPSCPWSSSWGRR